MRLVLLMISMGSLLVACGDDSPGTTTPKQDGKVRDARPPDQQVSKDKDKGAIDTQETKLDMPVDHQVGDINEQPADLGVDLSEDAHLDLAPDLPLDLGQDLSPDLPPDLSPDLPPDLSPDLSPDTTPPLKPLGEDCLEKSECASDHCADKVCCNEACDGTCEACDLATSKGTCTGYAPNDDPEVECSGFSCASYFAGFTGDECHYRSDVADNDANCNGARGCQTAADLCPSQPAGGTNIACTGICQEPDVTSCWGTTAGACATTDLGTITCGEGGCQTTVDRCQNQAEVTCEQVFAQLLGPTPYLSQADSPFSSITFSWFFLEDFEDDLPANTLGLTGTGPAMSMASSYGAALIDSVDNDDGVIDNKCTGCNDLWTAGTVTYSFDSGALGALPTHVGVVWTDGAGTLTFEAYGPCGLLGSIGPVSETGVFPDSVYTGTTGEDRFFGVIAPGGVTQIIMKNSSGGTETDHVQYGRIN